MAEITHSYLDPPAACRALSIWSRSARRETRVWLCWERCVRGHELQLTPQLYQQLAPSFSRGLCVLGTHTPCSKAASSPLPYLSPLSVRRLSHTCPPVNFHTPWKNLNPDPRPFLLTISNFKSPYNFAAPRCRFFLENSTVVASTTCLTRTPRGPPDYQTD